MKKDSKMGWPKAIASIISDITAMIIILGFIWCVSSCMNGHALVP